MRTRSMNSVPAYQNIAYGTIVGIDPFNPHASAMAAGYRAQQRTKGCRQ
jgi:hypothetical protein